MIYYTGDIHGSADALVRFYISKSYNKKMLSFCLGMSEPIIMVGNAING